MSLRQNLRPPLAAPFLTILLVASIAAAPARAGKSTMTELPLQSYFRDLCTVTVEIGGEQVPFLLDTGGGGTILTPGQASKLGIQPFGLVTGFRFNGEKLVGTRCGTVSFRLGGEEFRSEAGVLDLEPLGVKGVGGILGLQSFEGRAITLDLGGRRLILETPKSLQKRVAHMQELTVRAGRQAAGASLDLYARALAPTGDLWLEMDCGNLQSVLLAPHAYEQLGVKAPGDSVAPVRLEFAGLGPVTVQAQKVDCIYDGLLNSEFFVQRIVTFDLQTMRVWVGPRARS